jgi:SAM-dependent methyltransferase
MLEPSERDEGARSFRTVADAYESGRPDYPLDAIRWLLGPEPLDALDLGAGTGKLTRQLVAEGHRVIAAVEPLPDLREAARSAVAGAPVLAARAEDIPLPDACADAVTVAQAFHWFAPPAITEIARVLRPGGTLALLWNRRDRTIAWVQALWHLDSRQGSGRRRKPSRPVRHRLSARLRTAGSRKRWGSGGASKRRPPWKEALEASPLFGNLERKTFQHDQRLDLGRLLDLVRSRHYYASLPPNEQDELLWQVTRLWDEHPDLAGREEVTLRYETQAYRCTRTEHGERSLRTGRWSAGRAHRPATPERGRAA